MENYINLKSNKLRLIVQGVTLVGAMALTEQSVVLPIIVKYFSNSNAMVGVFTALLRGGAIIMQLYAAFHSRNDALVLPKMLKVFLTRFLSWFSIGFVILIFGHKYPALTLALFGISLFLFSFSAGFGVIYYQELMGKMFTKEYRGKLIAQRQLFSGMISIIGVLGISGYFLEHFEPPYSFSYIYLISGLIMGIGFLFVIPFKEKTKVEFVKEEQNFPKFIKMAVSFLKSDKQLRTQVIARLASFGFLLLMPFIILQAKDIYGISGKEIAIFAATQMVGAMFANILWGKLSGKGKDKLIVLLSFSITIFGYFSLLFYTNYYLFLALFFILGGTVDGFRLAFNNLLLSRAPEKYRTAYIAIYNNIIALGLFFSIPGGIILDAMGFKFLTAFAVVVLTIGLFFSIKLKSNCTPAKITE